MLRVYETASCELEIDGQGVSEGEEESGGAEG